MDLAKQYKIKRGRKKAGSYRAKPHPLSIILTVVGIAALVFVGISIYEPVYTFIMSLGERAEEKPPPQSSIAAPESSLPEEPVSEPEPEPKPPETVSDLRIAYLPAASLADIPAFLSTLPADINAVMVDLKDSGGQLLYRSANPRALQWEAVAEGATDLASLADTLKAEGYHLVARMQTFSDPIAARGDRVQNPIKYQNSDMLWLDNYANQGGKAWLNPYAPSARSYLVELAVEMAQQGAAMVVLDGMRFPDDMTGSATFGEAAEGIGRDEILKTFLTEMDAALAAFGVRSALALPATAVDHISKAARYGGNPLALGAKQVMLSILPEELSTGYLAEGVIVTRPTIDIGAAVSEVLAFAKSKAVGDVVIIPLLRGDMTGATPLSAAQMADQLAAATSAAGSEYVLYSPGGLYAATQP
jgi:hypothetical protein